MEILRMVSPPFNASEVGHHMPAASFSATGWMSFGADSTPLHFDKAHLKFEPRGHQTRVKGVWKSDVLRRASRPVE